MKKTYFHFASAWVCLAMPLCGQLAVVSLVPYRGDFNSAQEPPVNQPTTEHGFKVVPTKLEAFIKSTAQVAVEKHPLGTLKGHGTAQFFAVVARDPVVSDRTAKGLEIDLEDGTRQDHVYPDEDSLSLFEQWIEDLPKQKDKLVKDLREGDPRAPSWHVGAPDMAHVPLDPPSEVANTPTVGLYRNETIQEQGVYIMVPAKGHNPYYYFPDGELSTVAKFVAAGREWLNSN